MHDLTELLTSADSSALAGCHPSTLSRRVADGRLKPAYKFPGETGAFLFRRCDIEALRDELKTGAA